MVAVALGAGACGSGTGPAPADGRSDACSGLDGEAASVWNTDVQSSLSFSTRIYRGELEAADAELVVSRLNRFTRQWISARETACRQHEAGEIAAEAHDRLAACLAAVLELEREVIDLARTDARPAVWRSALLDDRLAECAGGRPTTEASPDAGLDGAPATPELKSNPFGGKKPS